jgi:hypothetical protein
VLRHHRTASHCLCALQEVDHDDQLKKKLIGASHYYYGVMLHSLSTVSETRNMAHRQATKEKRLEKQKKRVLKVTYQDNPDVFEREPSELLSDADRDEDTMVCSLVLFLAT